MVSTVTIGLPYVLPVGGRFAHGEETRREVREENADECCREVRGGR